MATKFDQDQVERFFRAMYRIRRVEETIAEIYPTDKVKSPVHLSIGQEAVSVGVCEALQLEDIAFGTYRGHALYLAKGGNLPAMIAELYGKETGCTRGMGGSMHLADPDCGVMGTSAIVATTIPLAVGYAYGIKCRCVGGIVVSFFGDGAVDEGVFYESLNFAGLKRLPVLFVCENNEWAIHSHHLHRRHSDNICERAGACGIRTMRIESGDVFDIFEATVGARQQILEGGGPVFLECLTSRWKEHVGPGDDFHLGYRDEDSVRKWRDRDEVVRLRKLLPAETAASIEVETDEEIGQAFIFAEKSVFPKKSQLFNDHRED